LWPQPALLKILLAKGLPTGLQMVMMSASGMVMIGLVNREGLLSTAAYSAAQQTWSYLQMPAMAIGAACSAMAAQNIGARKWDRVGRITSTGVIANFVSTGVVLTLMLVFGRPLLALFLGGSSLAIPVAQHIQYLASWGFLVFGVSMVLSGTMRANGVVVAPLVIMTIALYPVRIGFYTIFYPLIGANALWLSFSVGSVASCLMVSALYLHGGWRKARLLVPVSEEEVRETINAESDPAGRIAPTG
jgi:Na+-driven multidrug efflux pump